MITSAILGFIAPFLPKLLGLATAWLDNKHELKMFELRMKFAGQQFEWKMAEINAHADIEESRFLHAPVKSLGVQMLDAATTSNWGRGWLIVPFYLFVALDWIAGMVRPTITYAAFAGYLFYKWARFEMLKDIVPTDTTAALIAKLWDVQDFNILIMCLAFWFGNRAAEKAFGRAAR